MPETVYYTLEEISKMLGVSIWELKKEIQAGKLKASKFRQSHYVAEYHLADFLDEKRKRGEKKEC